MPLPTPSQVSRWPITLAGLALSILGPTVALNLGSSAPQREALTSLIGRSELVVSRRVNAASPVPQLWVGYLGAEEAQRQWQRRDHQLWWMAYPADGQPVLGLSAQKGLSLVYADALHQQADRTLAERSQAEGASPQGLDCASALSDGLAVHWTPAAVSRVAGPLAILFQQASHGCLRWSREASSIRVDGVVSQKPLKPSHQYLMSASSTQSRVVVASPALLDIRAEQARWVAHGLIQQPLIAEALAEHYNLSAEKLDGLLASAMQVRVLPSEQPDFQASVLLDLWRDPSHPDRLPATLASIRATLESRGFHPVPQGTSIRWFASADRERLLGGWSFNPKGWSRFSLAAAPDFNPTAEPEHMQGLEMHLNLSALRKVEWLGSLGSELSKDVSTVEVQLSPVRVKGEPFSPQNPEAYRLRGQLAVF